MPGRLTEILRSHHIRRFTYIRNSIFLSHTTSTRLFTLPAYVYLQIWCSYAAPISSQRLPGHDFYNLPPDTISSDNILRTAQLVWNAHQRTGPRIGEK